MRKFGMVLIAFAAAVFLYEGVVAARREKNLDIGFTEAVKSPVKAPPAIPFWAGWMLVAGTSLIAVNEGRFKDLKSDK